jgi:hypothetical protein
VDFALFGADDCPAPFGLGLAHRRVRLWHGISHAVAVRHLEKAVAGYDRAEPDWLEQYVVAWIAAHGAAGFELARRITK